jgi:hypothetical protein
MLSTSIKNTALFCMILCGTAAFSTAVRSEEFSINDAFQQAVATNPGVGEAAANRRATESELRQPLPVPAKRQSDKNDSSY